ncbi:MAG: transporter substrate-binding domain-containing protein [Phascolarctobacterium sp.]|nr:transporter substrate-binding domain-containing protein [Phascolarctobacterium sp.]
MFKKLIAGALLTCTMGMLTMTMDAEAGKIQDIQAAGVLKVGSTGDYAPMSLKDPATGEYVGLDVDIANEIGAMLGVKVEYVPTTWKTLLADTESKKFDMAICGITRRANRTFTTSLSNGYMDSWKTILCRKADAKKFKTEADIDKANVKVMCNEGGTNHAYAKKLKNAQVIVNKTNADIPARIAKGEADVMITEVPEAAKYCKLMPELAAPLMNVPFADTKFNFGIMMPQGDQDFLNFINFAIDDLNVKGKMDTIKAKHLQ